MEKDTVLVVEDEREIGELVRDYLEVNGFRVILAGDGEEAWILFQQQNPILVVLDIMLPKLSGIEVCKKIRTQSTIPIIMISAKKSETDKIIGLGIGADDYLAKPFSPGELVARIKAQLRRFKEFTKPSEHESLLLEFGPLVIDEKGFTVYVSGKQVELSAKEFQLLLLLAKHKGQVFSKEQLFDKIWGYDSYGDMNAVTVYIRKIREKIEPDPSHPVYIATVWGVGYKFVGTGA